MTALADAPPADGVDLVDAVEAELAVLARSLVAPRFEPGALCAETDPELFFPEKGGSTKEAKKLCASCDLRLDCLTWALDNRERFGIWGGLSERERRRLLEGTDPALAGAA